MRPLKAYFFSPYVGGLRRKFGPSSVSFSDEKRIRSVIDEVKLDAAAEAILDAKSKDEVLKILE
ncbi:MAG TPA: hypothetical protein PKY84_00455 [Thermosynergistes sp.]|nr:hypothetical protein [Thermosynergistes sp.]